MSTHITILPPVRQPGDVVAVLAVTAAAYSAVLDRLIGAVAIRDLPRIPGRPPQYMLEARTDGETPGEPIRVRFGMQPTPRELEILQHIADGHQNAEIAATLHVSVETVRTHVKHLIRRLGARDRTHAVHIGHMQGLLPGKGGGA